MPRARLQEALWGLAYRAHPYRWPVIGYAEDLNRVTVDDLTKFFGHYYQPGNVTVVVVGDVKADDVFRLIGDSYGAISGRKPDRARVPREPEQKEAREAKLNDGVATPRLAFGYPIVSAADEDTHALDILSTILFDGASSRCTQALVERKKLALSVSGIAYTPLYPGLFMLNATLRNGVAPVDFEKAWETLVSDIQAHGVTPDELGTAVRQLTMQTVDSVRTAHGLGTLVGTVTSILGDPELYKDDLVKYQHVTSADVMRVARRYLIPSHRNRVIMDLGAAPVEATPAGGGDAE